MDRSHGTLIASLPCLVALVALFMTAGCTPKIGDDCTGSLDCSQTGDRLCDATQPSGYCTIFGCEPDKCPEGDGVCVAFESVLDPSCGPKDDSQWARFERNFCMKGCEDDTDCRSGYECALPSARAARVIDLNPLASRICIVKVASSAKTTETPPPICLPGAVDWGGSLTPWTPNGTGGGGSGGTGGSGGGSGGTGGSGGGSGGAGGSGGN